MTITRADIERLVRAAVPGATDKQVEAVIDIVLAGGGVQMTRGTDVVVIINGGQYAVDRNGVMRPWKEKLNGN